MVGGKLTTHRRMFEDAVDVVVRQRGAADPYLGRPTREPWENAAGQTLCARRRAP
jgi:glycerol-3-phosphate dehydrogenase